MGALCQKGGAVVVTDASQVSDATSESRGRRTRFLVPEMWAALAVGVIWLVVLVDALFGPDIVSSNVGTFTRIPSAIVLAFFAWLACSGEGMQVRLPRAAPVLKIVFLALLVGTGIVATLTVVAANRFASPGAVRLCGVRAGKCP